MNKRLLIPINLILISLLLGGIKSLDTSEFQSQFFKETKKTRQGIITLSSFSEFDPCRDLASAGAREFEKQILFSSPFTDSLQSIQVAMSLYDFAVRKQFAVIQFNVSVIAGSSTADGFRINVNCFDVTEFTELKFSYYATSDWDNLDIVRYQKTFDPVVTSATAEADRQITLKFEDDIISLRQYGKMYSVTGLHLTSTISNNNDPATMSTRPKTYKHYWSSSEIPLTQEENFNRMKLRFSVDHQTTQLHYVFGNIVQWNYFLIQNSYATVQLSGNLAKGVNPIYTVQDQIYSSGRNLEMFIGMVGFRQERIVVNDVGTYTINDFSGLGFNDISQAFSSGQLANQRVVRFAQKTDNFLSGVTLSIVSMKSHNCIEMDSEGFLYQFLAHQNHLYCLKECNERQLPNEILELCEPCWDLRCLQCSIDAKNCLSCEDGYYASQHFLGFDYVNKDNHVCQPCVDNCRKCDAYTDPEMEGGYPDGGQCTECFYVDHDNSDSTPDVLYRVQYSDKSCVQDCPGGQYLPFNNVEADRQLCGPCHDDCSTCADLTGSSDECTLCSDLSKRLLPPGVSGHSSCVICTSMSTSDTDLGYYRSQDFWCLPCHESCSQCIGPNIDQCTECRYHNQDSQSVFKANAGDTAGRCIVCNSLTDSYVGIYFDGNSQFCLPCHADCYNCIGPEATECTSCVSGSLNVGVLPQIYFKLVIENPLRRVLNHQGYEDLEVYGRCVNCQSDLSSYADGGFYLDEEYKCRPCDQSCSKCIGPSEDECYRCANVDEKVFNYQFDDNYVDDYYGTCGICSEHDRHYDDDVDATYLYRCQACHQSCLRCVGPNPWDCIKCEFPQEGVVIESHDYDILDYMLNIKQNLDRIFLLENRLSELQLDLNNVNSQISTYESNVNGWTSTRTTKQAELVAVESDIDNNEANLVTANNQLVLLEGQLTNLNLQLDDLEDDLYYLEGWLNDHNYELNLVIGYRSNAADQKDRLNAEIDYLNPLIINLNAVKASHERRVAKARDFINDFTSKQDAINIKIGDTTSLIIYNQNQINNINSQINSISNQLTDSKDPQLSEALILELNNLNAAQANYVEQISQLTVLKEQFQDKYDLLVLDIEEHTSYLDFSLTEINLLNTRIGDALADLDQAIDDLINAEIDWNNYNDRVTSQNAAISITEGNIIAKNSAIDSKQMEIVLKQEEIADKEDEIVWIENQLSRLYSQRTTLQGEIGSLTSDIDDAIDYLNLSLYPERTSINSEISGRTSQKNQRQDQNDANSDQIENYYFNLGGALTGECLACSQFCYVGMYKQVEEDHCRVCPEQFCATCNEEGICQRCLTDFWSSERRYVLNGQCVRTCPSRYQIDDDHCRECHQTCGECHWALNEQACYTCDNPNERVVNPDAPGKCGICEIQNDGDFTVDGLYTHSSSPNCLECVLNCHDCNGEGECYHCNIVDGVQLYVDFYTKQCLPECPDGQYLDEWLCQPCHDTCGTCNEYGATLCLTCIPGYHFHPELNQCVVCQLHYGWYSPAQGDTCAVCSVEDCAFCPGDECRACFTDLMLSSDQLSCAPQCPEHEADIGDGERCDECHATCKTCDYPFDEAACTSCQYAISTLFDDRCIICQEEGYHYTLDGGQSTTCQLCIESCISCSGPTADECIECNGETFLTAPIGDPIRYCAPRFECPVDLFFDGQYCSDCTSNCLGQCFGPTGQECEKCQEDLGFYKHPDSNNIIRCLQCPEGFIGQSWDGSCGECAPNCMTCEPCRDCPLEGLVDSCLECVEGFYLDSETNQCKLCDGAREVINEQFCLECPPFFYADKQENTCKACVNNCEFCSGSEFFECEKCEQDYYKYLRTETCLALPADGERYFLYNENEYIDDCLENCLFCDGHQTQHCFVCQDGYGLQNGECIECGDTHFYGCENNRYCLDCSDGCRTCTGSHHLECQECLDTHCMDETHTCVPRSATYADEEGNCSPCMRNCLQCDDATTCNVCQADYFWVTGFDMQECEQICHLLPEGFQWGYDGQKCIECVTAEQNETCVDECDFGFSISPSKRCKKCQDFAGENLVYMPTTQTCQTQCEDGFALDPYSEFRQCREISFLYQAPNCGLDMNQQFEGDLILVPFNVESVRDFREPFSGIPKIAASISSYAQNYENNEGEYEVKILEITRSSFKFIVTSTTNLQGNYIMEYLATTLQDVDIIPFSHQFEVPLVNNLQTFQIPLEPFYTGQTPDIQVSIPYLSGFAITMESGFGVSLDTQNSIDKSQIELTIQTTVPNMELRKIHLFIVVFRDPDFEIKTYQIARDGEYDGFGDSIFSLTTEERNAIAIEQTINGVTSYIPFLSTVTYIQSPTMYYSYNVGSVADIALDIRFGTTITQILIPLIRVCPINQYLYQQVFCLDSCPSGFRIINGVCQICSESDCSDTPICQLGQVASLENECVDCPDGCKTCAFVESELACESCFPGFDFDTQLKTCNCESSRHTLSSCANSCNTCATNYFPINFAQEGENVAYCQLGCQFGYISQDGNFCLPCNPEINCLTCSDSEFCDSCIESFYMTEAKVCVGSCPAGTYERDSQLWCIQCDVDACIDCYNDVAICEECSSQTVLHQNQCLDSCPEGFGKDGLSNYCIACADFPACKVCTEDATLGACGTCDDVRGFSSQEGTCTCRVGQQRSLEGETCVDCIYAASSSTGLCVQSCQLGQVPVNFLCTDCTQLGCDLCTPEDLSDCQICNGGQYIKDGLCIEGPCPTGTYDYLDTEKLECEVCRDQVYESDLSCVVEDVTLQSGCPQGHYLIPNTIQCKTCTDSNCRECNDGSVEPAKAGVCFSCITPFVLQLDTNDCSSQTCAARTEPDSSGYVCIPCVHVQLDGSTCDEFCQAGSYDDGTQVDCQPCSEITGCTECALEGENLVCSLCNGSEGLKLNPDISIYTQSVCINCAAQDLNYHSNDNYCQVCPEGQYASVTLTDCVPCPVQNCSTCDHIPPQGQTVENEAVDPIACLACKVGFFLNEAGNCVAECGDFLFQNVNTGRCQLCVNNEVQFCQTCETEVLGGLGCQLCADGFYMDSIDGQNICVLECQPGYFADDSDGLRLCKLCDISCSECSGTSTSCEVCNADYVFNAFESTTCVTACNIKEYVQVEIGPAYCAACEANCDQCAEKSGDSSSCTFCSDGWYMALNPDQSQADYCTQDCGENTTFLEVPRLCNSCVQFCTNCPGDVCDTCEQGFFPDDVSHECLCPIGQYLPDGGLTCQLCAEGCLDCQGPTLGFVDCGVCDLSNGYFRDNQNSICTQTCPEEFFGNPISGDCEACPSSCKTCPDAQSCSVCIDDHYRLEGVCTLANPPLIGYATPPDQSIDLVACNDSNCKYCEWVDETTNTCTECNTNFVFFSPADKTCVICPIGTYTLGDYCEDCHADCHSCTDYDVCQICSGIQVMDQSDNCVCPEGYWKKIPFFEGPNDDISCERCNYRCSSCSDDESCDQCAPGREGQSCDCPAGTFESPCGTQPQCETCHASCQLCRGPGELDCLVCAAGKITFYQDQGIISCIDACPDGFFTDGDGLCAACNYNCATCFGPSDEECEVCQPHAFQLGSSCIVVSLGQFGLAGCPQAYQFQNGIRTTYHNSTNRECMACPENCEFCLSSSHCLACGNSKLNWKGACIDSCPQGTYQSEDTCEACDSSCATCVGYSNQECSSCPDNNFQLKGVLEGEIGICVTTCPRGYWTDREESQCVKCENCDECVNDRTCQKCPFGYYSFTDPNDSNVVTCHDVCPRGSFLEGSKCVSCKPLGLINYNGKCVKMIEKCPKYHYMDEALAECIPCHNVCAGCTGQLEDQCTECKADYYLFENQCLSLCPPFYFNDITTSTCGECPANCSSCKNSSTCLQCDLQNGYFLSPDLTTCLTECPTGYFGDQVTGNCHSCSYACGNCFSAGNQECSNCAADKFLLLSACVNSCPRHLYPLPNGSCGMCHPTCFTCSGPDMNNCLSCPESLYIINNMCLPYQFCAPGKYADKASRTCKNCHESCSTCIDGTVDGCSECAGDLHLLPAILYISDFNRESLNNGRCVATCPSLGYFQEGGICQECNCSCATCSDASAACATCATGYFRDPSSGDCVLNCPSESIKNYRTKSCDLKRQGNCGISHHLFNDDDGKCRVCHQSCKRCDGAGTTKCISCYEGSFLRVISSTQSECIPSTAACGDGFYKDSKLNVCMPCAPKCKTCSSSTVCTACRDGSDRILGANGSCNCPDGRMIDSPDGLCPACDAGCKSCTVFSHNCHTCVATRDQTAISRCPCPVGTIASANGSCTNCSNKCLSCQGNADTCGFCRGDRTGADCTCPSGMFDDGVSEFCQGCDYKCATCATAATSCLTCGPNRNSSNGCECNAGFFEDPRSLRCLPCSNKCASCSGDANNCTVCKGNRLAAPACSCPSMQADKGGLNCEPFQCAPECGTCNELGCLSCQSNRVGPFSLQCICPIEENGIGREQLGTATCGTCYIGVPSATFTPNLQDILLNLGKPLALGDLFLDMTNQLCEELFVKDVLQKMGQNPICYVTENDIGIQLGQMATIRENEMIAMKNNSKPLINFDDCREIDNSLKFLNAFTRASLQLPTERLIPKVFFQKLSNPVSICDDVVLNIISTDVTGNRTPLQIVWKLDSIVPTSAALQTTIEQILAANLGKTQIVIPSSDLVEKTTVSFTVTFTNFLDVAGSEKIEFTTSSAETLIVTLTGNDKTVYRRNKFRLNVETQHLTCQAGTTEIKQSVREIQLTYKSGPEDIGNQIIKLESNTEFMIEEYILKANSTYVLELNINVPSQPDISVKREVDVNVGMSDLLITLNGAQDLISVNQLTKLDATVRNVDLPAADDTLALYSFEWKLFDNNINQPAQDQLTAIEDESGTVISEAIETSTSNVQTILPDQLEPFHTIEVTVYVTSADKLTSAVIRQTYSQTFITTTSPVSSHNFFLPADLMGKEYINLQDRLNFEIELLDDENLEDMFYSIQIQHEETVKATYTFQSNVFSFAIWDQPIDLRSTSSGDTRVTLVNTQYNSKTSLLSTASLDIKINPIPTGAQFSIYRVIEVANDDGTDQTAAATPADGTTTTKAQTFQTYDPIEITPDLILENSDRYLISIDGCEDPDGNLEYEFFYYSSIEDMQLELRSSIKNQIKRIRQRSSKESEEVELVLGNIVLLGSCYDGNNGVLNITLPLNVVAPENGQVAAALRNLQTTPITGGGGGFIEETLKKIQPYQKNTFTEVSKLAGFVMNNLRVTSKSFTVVDNYVIERLFFNMFNNTQFDWVKQSVKILGEVFSKPNIIQYNTNYTACHIYLDLIKDFINQTLTTYNNDVASALKNNLPKPSTDNKKEILLSIAPVLSSILESSFQMSPKKMFTDIQTKFERAHLQTINTKIIQLVIALQVGLRQGSLPGAPLIVYEDKRIRIQTGVTTPAAITERLNPPVSVDTIIGINAIDQNQIAGVSSGKTDGYLDFALVLYQLNIFISDPSFHYYRSTFPVYDITLQESKTYLSKAKTAQQNTPQRILQSTTETQTGAKEMELNPPYISYFFPIEQTNSIKQVDLTHLTCISKHDAAWTAQECSQKSIIDTVNRTLGIECTCRLPVTITLVDDTEAIYREQGISALQQVHNGRFNVALEPIFYAFLFFTFEYVILMIWAFYQDQSDAAEEPVKVIKRQITRMQTMTQRQSMFNAGLVPLDSNNNRKASVGGVSGGPNDSHRSNQSQNNKEVVENPQFHFKPDNQEAEAEEEHQLPSRQDEVLPKNSNQKIENEAHEIEMKNFILAVDGAQPSNIVSPQLDSEEQDLIGAAGVKHNYSQKEIDINIPPESGQRDSKPVESFKRETYTDYEDINLTLIDKDDHSLINYYLMHHSIISIFRIYMKTQPRQFRFTEEYVQINLYLWSMLLFSSVQVSENAVVILVTLFAVQIICSMIVEGPLLSKAKFLRVIGYLIIAGIFAGSVLISVVQALELEKTVIRNAFYNFLILILFDYCIFDFIKCTFLFYKKEHQKHHPKNLD